MKMDTNTNGHRQWFYFSIKNLLPGVIKLNIYRFKKKYSLFQRGMKPYIRSLKAKENWTPGGTKIAYRCEKQPNQYGVAKQKASYYLTFQYNFVYPEDQVFFCSGLPYTVSFLRTRLDTFCDAPLISGITCKTSTIGRSMCGQQMPLLTIQSSSYNPNKNYIVINARTHAGETSCSWVLDGFLERVTTCEEMQQWIRQNNISLKILPMLNIDGVFMGNYRTGIMGQDFNRKFASGKKQIFPEVHILKKLVAECKKNGKLFLFIDLHGHSILKNSFIYGPVESLFHKNPMKMLPFTLWHSSKYFKMSSCKFKFQKDLIETARVYFQIKQIILAFTFEISLGLYFHNGRTLQFMEADYKSLGVSLADSFSNLLTKDKIQSYRQVASESLIAVAPTVVPIAPLESTSLSKRCKQTRLPSFKKDNRRPGAESTTSPLKGRLERRQKQSKLQRIEKKKSQQNMKEKPFNGLEVDEKNESKGFRQKKFSLICQPVVKLHVNNNKNKSSLLLNGNTAVRSTRLEDKDRQFGSDANQISLLKRKESQPRECSLKKNFDDQRDGISRQSSTKRSTKEVHFKIRRKSDILKGLPESLRKKVAPKGLFSMNSGSKYFQEREQEQEEPFVFERSATHNPTRHKEDEIQFQTEPNELQIINENLSDEYVSMNDSDSSSEDLCQKEKQYLLECIRNNRQLHTQNDENEVESQPEEEETEDNSGYQANINGFKQIRFKSIQPRMKMQGSGNQGLRQTKRDLHKFRQLTHKSLCRAGMEDDSHNASMLPPNIVQRKQLNERIQRKTQRQPYFLIQIRSKNN